ncbi:MAG TPA: NmrA family NAD(P)-binding protein, partial [Chroococcales cyanobacterium]
MPKDLSNVKIAVTGAGGLVGGSLVEYLAGRGAAVLAVVRQSGKDQLTGYARKYKGPGSIAVRVADVRDER